MCTILGLNPNPPAPKSSVQIATRLAAIDILTEEWKLSSVPAVYFIESDEFVGFWLPAIDRIGQLQGSFLAHNTGIQKDQAPGYFYVCKMITCYPRGMRLQRVFEDLKMCTKS